jgi:hypothetical protein
MRQDHLENARKSALLDETWNIFAYLDPPHVRISTDGPYRVPILRSAAPCAHLTARRSGKTPPAPTTGIAFP